MNAPKNMTKGPDRHAHLGLAKAPDSFLAQSLPDVMEAAQTASAYELCQMFQQVEVQKLLGGTAGFSPFLARLMRRHPVFLEQAFQMDAFQLCQDEIAAMEARVSELDDEQQIKARLRGAKDRVALVTALCDIGDLWPLATVTAILSDLAEAATRAALNAAWRHFVQRGELRPGQDGFVILALGKLGGRELNYSSDIDLIPLYDGHRFPAVGKRTPGDIAVRLTKKTVAYLQDRTADGYVFRVDLRLRPDPGATPVAVSLNAAESYYQSIGQTWERAAFIKARPIAGDFQAAAQFLEHLRPFIWRRHLDFTAIDDIHAMKARIHEHHQHEGIGFAGHDIKLGQGGIREIEFFAQIHQLISGGRRSDLQVRPTLDALEALSLANDITAETYEGLCLAYHFFRRIEHRLQMINDQQTQQLPTGPEQLEHFAHFLGFRTAAMLEMEVLHHLHFVHRHYADLLPTENGQQNQGPDFEKFEDQPAARAVVSAWQSGRYRALRTGRARTLLNKIMAPLFAAFSQSANPDIALKRFDQFLAQLPAGVQLFSLFNANPNFLNLVAKIMGTAPALAEQLARRPVLLESFLSPDFFAPLAQTEQLEKELQAQLNLARSFEEVLDRARIWVNERRFQLGVLSLEGLLNPVITGQNITRLADAALKALYPFIVEEFQSTAGKIEGGQFAILGLGGYGARAMTYTSDLDLVFLYECPDDAHAMGGRSPLSANQYYSRLSQRIISALTILTGEGRLFDIDMRLRPSGRAGIIAVSLAAFEAYQQNEAWTWEHMTLLKSRMIVAPETLHKRVENIIKNISSQKHGSAKLIDDVRGMRARYDQEFKAQDYWELNAGHGGLADLNWITQLKLLENGLNTAFHMTEMDAQLELLAKHGALTVTEAESLRAAWHLLFSARALRRLLLGSKGNVEKAPVAVQQTLAGLLGHSNFHKSCLSLEKATHDVSKIFEHYIGYP